MKLLYAYDKNRELTSITKINKTNKGIYYCINCEGILIPKLGNIRKHHFAHKFDHNCSFETYLHKISKIKFYEKYQYCLENRLPFYFTNSIERYCNTCINVEPVSMECFIDITEKDFDLTKSFDKIYIEKSHNGYVADILLKSTKFNDVLFIEFAVSHVCEANKIRSGIKIIEIDVESEDDIEFIDKQHIPEASSKVKHYNIYWKKLYKNINRFDTCKEEIETFFVFDSGKALLVREPIAKTYYMIKSKNYQYYQAQKYNESKTFSQFVEHASHIGVNVKNCFACRFSARNTRYNRMFDIFCKKHKAEVENSNVGADCENFWRIKSIYED